MKKKNTTESAADRTRRLWDGDITSTARRLLEELISEEAAIEVLLPWIADRVRAAVRNEVRQAEANTWMHPAGHDNDRQRKALTIRTQTGGLPSLDNMEVLLSLPVLVPGNDGVQTIAWRDMTIKDHQARIGLLNKPLASINDAIGRHQWAISEITKYGVRCLGDIDLALLKADLTAQP